MALQMDPEFAVAMEPFLSAPLPVYTDAISLRAGNDAAAEVTFQQIPYPDGIEESIHNATSIDGTNITYRVAPEHPFPAAVEDIYSTITWLQENADQFNVDPARIVLHGQSAGAGVVAGTAIMARDKKLEKNPLSDLSQTFNESSEQVSDLINPYYLIWGIESEL
ncbi:lipase 2 [Fusarium albosuccineum]|uniref:Lipase 2 n=1 Tax=Fusarium albosuccineum TaxID=1237068 RepID=A0A8H4L1N5_9HYPO|nr:lipase 2 [Fusarium albosuccineum]